jgi:hypothetical protein
MPKGKEIVPKPSVNGNGESSDDTLPFGANAAEEKAADPVAPSSRLPETPEESSERPNPFDPRSYRRSGPAKELGVRKLPGVIPVRKPAKNWFVRVHPDPEFHFEAPCLEIEDPSGVGKEIYLLAPDLANEEDNELTLDPNFRRVYLAAAINRKGDVFLWTLNVIAEGKAKSWYESGMAAVKTATKSWVRVVPNTGSQGYDTWEATGKIPEPEWPEGLSMPDLLKMAFKSNLIDSLDHPIARQLRREA